MNGADVEHDIKLPSNSKIHIANDTNFESFMSQFQSHTHLILCIIDGKILRYYSREGPFPSDIVFDRKNKGEPNEYYFKSKETGTQYCVFSRENAVLFYPRLNEVDPTGRSEIIPRLFPRKLEVSTYTTTKRPSIIEPVLSSSIIQPYIDNTGRLGESDKATITRQIITNTQPVSDKVIVVDEGSTYIFPNPNFPVEIKIYQPKQI